ncbi:MAG TPA: DUF188 domain-containing protein [Spirochaetales bacterium]|nr:DUF188 domain-containing protein [Spirochaetales bacterium]
MTIWADADSLAREAKEYIGRRTRVADGQDKAEVRAVFVADKPIGLPQGKLVSLKRVEQGTDAADTLICESAIPGDIIVTRDLPLAARALGLGLIAINDRGDRWDEGTLRERLSLRDRAMELRQLGLAPAMQSGKSYGPKEAQAFARALDKAIHDALKKPLS